MKTTKTTIILLLVAHALACMSTGCGRPAGSGAALSDRAFADLAVEVVRLNERYAGQPDSLAFQRAALFRARGVSREALEGFIAVREEAASAGAWAPVLGHLKEALETGAFGNTRDAEGDSLRGRLR